MILKLIITMKEGNIALASETGCLSLNLPLPLTRVVTLGKSFNLLLLNFLIYKMGIYQSDHRVTL